MLKINLCKNKKTTNKLLMMNWIFNQETTLLAYYTFYAYKDRLNSTFFYFVVFYIKNATKIDTIARRLHVNANVLFIICGRKKYLVLYMCLYMGNETRRGDEMVLFYFSFHFLFCFPVFCFFYCRQVKVYQ